MRNVFSIKLVLCLFLLTGCLSTELTPGATENENPSEDAPETVTKVFAYAGGQYTNVINSFEVDKTTGALNATSQPTVAGENLPMIQAVLFNKKFLLSINYNSNSLSVYSINQTDGNLTLVAHNSLGGGSSPAWVVTHPTLPVAYVAENGSSKVAVIDIDPDTGAATIRNRVNAGSGVTALEINSSGSVLYSVDQNVNQIGIYIVNGAGDIALANTAATPGGSNPNQAKLHPSGNYLYVANWSTNDVTAFSVSGTSLTLIHTVTGATGVGSTPGGGGGVYTVSVSPDGKYLYANRPYGANFGIMSINQSTGELTYTGKEDVVGAVNFAFWGDLAFLVCWQGGGGQPIQSRTYDTNTGLSPMVNQTANMLGLYQMVVVEIEQP